MAKLRLSRPTTPATLFEGFTMFADELERRIAFGSATITWPGGKSKSDSTTVTHELSNTPQVVLATVLANSGEAEGIVANVVNVGATTFQTYGEYVAGTTPALGTTRTVYWFAIV